MDRIRFIIIIAVIIFIFYCFTPRIENFGLFKDIGKFTKKIGKSIKKDVDVVGKTIEKDTKIVGKFIVKEGKSIIHGVENFSEEVFKYTEKFVKTAVDDIKDSAEIAWSLVPIGGVIDAIYQEITTGHIDWQADFDPCYIISKDLQKVSKMISPLVNLISKNLAKEIVRITQIKTLTVDKLQPSLNACILSAFIINTGSGAAAGVSGKACSAGGSGENTECNVNCQTQIPKLICDLLSEIPCQNLKISSSVLYPSKKSQYFNICKFGENNNQCQGSKDIQTLIGWIKCLLAPEACAIAKSLGAVCTLTESLVSGDSLKKSLSNTGASIEGFQTKKKTGAYHIKTFQGDTVFQCSNNQEYNLSVNKGIQNNLYKNMDISTGTYNNYTKWRIIYNKDRTVYIQNSNTGNYLGYGNIPLNYDQLYENMNKNMVLPMLNFYARENILYTNSEELIDDNNKWILEIQGYDSYLYVFPTIVTSSYYIKNYSTNDYLSLEEIENSDGTNKVICSKKPYEWTLIPDKYYQKNKYYKTS